MLCNPYFKPIVNIYAENFFFSTFSPSNKGKACGRIHRCKDQVHARCETELRPLYTFLTFHIREIYSEKTESPMAPKGKKGSGVGDKQKSTEDEREEPLQAVVSLNFYFYFYFSKGIYLRGGFFSLEEMNKKESV